MKVLSIKRNNFPYGIGNNSLKNFDIRQYLLAEDGK